MRPLPIPACDAQHAQGRDAARRDRDSGRRHVQDRLPDPALRRAGTDAARADGVGSMAGQSSFRVIGAATTRSRGVRFGEIDAMGRPSAPSAPPCRPRRRWPMSGSITSSPASRAPAALLRAGRRGGARGQPWSPSRMSPACWRPATCPISAHGREVLHAQPVNFALDHRIGPWPIRAARSATGWRPTCTC